MANGLKQVLGHLQQGGGLTDGQLLGRFIATRDEAAFAALVRRHGPMVLGVCRRVLSDFHHAEDAFQATFLVLARKATAVRKHESVGSWLYGTAYRTALEARTMSARRRARERPMNDMPHPEVLPAEAHDWMPLLDRELNLLPEKYRAAIILCDLEGRTRREAARLLAITEGTLSSRLARGRALLAKRLARCGVTLSGGAMAVALSNEASAAVSASLVSCTAKSAALVAAGQVGAVSTTALLLMKGVMKAMLMKKLRLVVGAVLVVVALGAVGLGYQAGGSGSAQAAPPDKPKNELEALRRENELLKLNLEVVLEKVRAQEAELREFRARDAGQPRPGSGLPRGSGGPGTPPGGSDMRPPGVPGTGPGGLPPGATDLPGSNGVPPGPGTGRGAPGMGPGGIPPGTPGLPGAGGRRPVKVEEDDAVPGSGFGGGRPMPGSGTLPSRTQADPVQEAEAALKALREAKDPESQRRAAEAVEKALRYLKERQDAERKGPPGRH
jgi:RNA polymerase sigma factor (sigma-70 family)